MKPATNSLAKKIRVGWADREADQRADGDDAQRGHDIIADGEAQRNHERDEGDRRVYGTGQAAPDEEERVKNDQHDHAAFCTDLADERAEHSLQRARGRQNAHAGDAHIDQNDDVRHGDEALRDCDKHIKQVDRCLIDPVIGARDDHFDVIYGFTVKLTSGDDVGQHGCQQDYDQENDIDMRDGANTVVVAQQICELPIYSGMTFRTITWLVLGLAGLIYVVIYAEKVRKNPSASLSSYKPDTQELQNENMQKAATTRDKWVVFTLFVAVIAVVVLTVKFSLSMVQMAGLYIIIGIIGGLVAGYKPNEIAAMFTKYGKEMFTAALVLGMAKAVSLVLTQGNIIDTMVYGMSSILGGLPAGLSAVIMFLIQTIVNFFINSGSGQAAAMMPIMAPLSDLIGVSRQTAILAFQMGDGLSNMIWPTSASMMAYVFAANEKFESYLKFVLPIFLIVSVLGAIMLVIGTAIGY